MTHVTCPGCALRFAPAAAAPLASCPFCGGQLASAEARSTIGYQLIDRVAAIELPAARADALPAPPRPLDA